jgi:hypothetical protein
MATLQQQLVTTPSKSFFNLFDVGIDVRYIGVRVPGNSVKVTKLAIRYADICCIDVSIDLPGDLTMHHLLLPQLVGYVHNFAQRGIMVKHYTLLYRKEVKPESFSIQIRQIHF